MTCTNCLSMAPIGGSNADSLRGPWQEIELRVHSLNEIDHPAVLDKCLTMQSRAFEKLRRKKSAIPEDVMPWKVLGKKWHFSRKGFPIGKRPVMAFRSLGRTPRSACGLPHPKGQLLWNNQQVVHLLCRSSKRTVGNPTYQTGCRQLNSALTGPSWTIHTSAELQVWADDRKLVSGRPGRHQIAIPNARECPPHAELEDISAKQHLAGVSKMRPQLYDDNDWLTTGDLVKSKGMACRSHRRGASSFQTDLI